MAPAIVLVVDDNPADVELVQDAFRDLGIRADVRVAGNGRTALDLLQHIAATRGPRPAGVLLDLNMPGVHGRDVLAFIKADPYLAVMPTFILTSSASPRDRDECLAMGADAYLIKPTRLAQLNALVRDVATRLHLDDGQLRRQALGFAWVPDLAERVRRAFGWCAFVR